MVQCNATVSTSPGLTPLYEFTLKKDNRELHSITTTSSSISYPLGAVRVADSGSYKCFLSTGIKSGTSEWERLTVTGTQTPLMRVDPHSVREGDTVNATCSAPGERGTLIFTFYVNDKEVHNYESDNEDSTVELRLKDSGYAIFTCSYAVRLYTESVQSSRSSPFQVFVREIDVSVHLSILPSTTVIEADNFSVSCAINSTNQHSVSLIKGVDILSKGWDKTEYHEDTVKTEHSGEYMCKVEINGVPKSDKKVLTVKELFTRPILTSEPREAFAGDFVRLKCQSANFSSERIQKDDVNYSIFKDGLPQAMGNIKGQMTVHAGPSADGNYTCFAQAKSISKESTTLVFRSKVLASKPVISVSDKVILGQQFDIHCKSNGTLPIHYTLYREGVTFGTYVVTRQGENAIFTTSITRKEQIHSFTCLAKNSATKTSERSETLKAFVIEPLGKPLLTTLPIPENVEEGSELYLICNVPSGTPPVTFKWYSSGGKVHLNSATVNNNSSHLVISRVERMDSGDYHCEALNPASHVRSDTVRIQVKLATWKKGLIGAICLLVVAAIVLVVVIRLKAKRVGMNVGPSVWSERPSSSGSSDRSTTRSHNDPDVEYTEVVHPHSTDPARAPLKKGTDTVYSELQTAPQDSCQHADNAAVEYAELNHDLPDPVD